MLADLIRRLARRKPWLDDVLADVAEETAALDARSGPAQARAWRRRELRRLCAELLRERAARVLHPIAILFFIGDRPMSSFLQELVVALRALRRRPGVTTAIILTLAIGLGVNAAIYSSIDSLLLKPFVFPDVDRIVMVSEMTPTDEFPKETVSPGLFDAIARDAHTLTDVAAYGWAEMNLSGGPQPERVAGFTASEQFFNLVGATPEIGRFFTHESFAQGGSKEIVLSDRLWRSHFGADPSVLGRTVHVDSQPAVIVGVAAIGFTFPEGADAWTPMTFPPADAASFTQRSLTVFGRVATGRTRGDVDAELSALYAHLRAAHPDELRGYSLSTRTLTQGMVDVGMPTILVLWQAAAVFVLLIGCTNIVNLLLAQGVERQRELAVRLAIGASRVRIARQLLMESLTVSLAAVPAALGVAWITLHLMKAAMPATLIRFVPGWDKMSVNLPLMGWTTLGALVTGVLFGLLPAVQASRGTALAAVKGAGDGGRSQTAGIGRNRARRALVIAELALALPLLVASALAVSSVQTFVTGKQGYEPNGLLRASVALPDAAYPDDAARQQFAARLVDEIERVPLVSSAAVGSLLPASGSNSSRTLQIDGRAVDKDHPLSANMRIVTPHYFDTMRIPMLDGRAFGTEDRGDSTPVVIVSASFAAKFFPGESALGKRMKVNLIDHGWITIAGVCGDVIDDWFANRNVPTIYLPVAQVGTHWINLVVRTPADPLTLEAPVRRTLASIDPNLPAYSVRTMTAALKERTTGLRFIGGLMAAFGAIALLLAAIGIYSVMSFYVTLRRKEMGVRLALGASPADVLRMTMAQASWLSVIGVAIGAALALALTRLMEQAMLGTSHSSAGLLALVSLTLLVVAALASFVPSYGATKVDPALTLRD